MEFLAEQLQAASISKTFPVAVVSTDDELASAKQALVGQTLLAFDCEGVDLGRRGQVCIVQISSRDKCFLFDVLGKPPDSGIVLFLKSLLESNDIVKIIHDCRMDSDALFHLCDITVTNCHDTQVWDKILQNLPRGYNLNRTLLENGCEANEQRDSSVYEANNAFWATRPMTEQMTAWASGDVSSLFELYDKQVAKATPEQAAQAKEATVAIENYLRPCVTETTVVQKMARLIGPGGSNLRIMQELIPGSFVQMLGTRASKQCCVYAPNEESLAKAMAMVKLYQ